MIKTLIFWCPYIGNVGTAKAVLESAKSLSQSKNFKCKVINSFGEFDEDTQPGMDGKSGFLRITGRIKELIITAGGENIPPVLIENEMKGAMTAVSNVMVIGDKRKFLSMLVSLKTVPDKDMVPTDVLAGDAQTFSTYVEATDDARATVHYLSHWAVRLADYLSASPNVSIKTA